MNPSPEFSEKMNQKIKEAKVKAEKFKDVPAPFGEDIDFNDYPTPAPTNREVESLKEIDEDEKIALSKVGIDINEKSTSGSYVQVNNEPIYSKMYKNIEIMPITEAFKKHELSEYYWNVVDIKDKYAARVENELSEGYFIYAPKGVKETIPLQTCLLIGKEDVSQNVHNIIIVEEGAELNVITGCTTSPHVKSGLHLGVSEFYIKKGGKLTYTMIHNWGENVHVRPRTGVKLEEDAVFINNYVTTMPVKSIQSYPTAYCEGDNSKATFQTIVYGSGKSKYDMGSRVVLNGKGSSADMISRVIAVDESEIVSRGHLVGAEKEVKGHLECRGLILSKEGRILAVPELEATETDLDLSHEAAVGKIAEDQLIYLMSRGLTEDEATSLIIKGFLSVDITGLPEELAKSVKNMMDMTLENAM
ncbi:Fe-S cluster assembly scaffold protein SufB [Methanococcus voltae]|uniref:Fe-S cluster assembly scaffold protein SufB n=3 Tax=Methanococcus voltae TaxID=2188 RepID=A0A8J7UR25_METVO|nr:SufD family Fe-S cluster assembly protein [Methanococcus voltae]MBP2171719.1 Fe-S cluster assembly scaffold protein SufB [Methanococcus voltae]MBP2201343.1 Fe-S cluster assembly scaffold protein SufB [Methanococcus voltae]MCS3922715.1 Fe-S cluster assembly scaffold protein SufB [Methanococcus voltae PS]